jgi:hypothetical protein
MKRWIARSDLREGTVPAEVSVEFLLRIAPVRHWEGGPRAPHAGPEEVEFEIQAATGGRILSLHRHGPCYDE